ncbi:MAG: DUF2089 domain-containing protein [Firmicutes bacterium]|nr:DUF2089 domain-containing protein [Bacillota bacterium]
MARYGAPGRCPVCDGPLEVTRLRCTQCGTAIEGQFRPCRFCQLNREQQRFVEVFLTSRGNIKEVERVLGMSYPTVRSRLDQVIEALGYRVERESEAKDAEAQAARRKAILEALSRGEIDTEQALKQLKH